jgi:outer membrane beta-barrel protein
MKKQLVLALLVSSFAASAADAAPKAAPRSAPQRADVEAVKERYWQKGEDSDTGVVQNRLYSKSGKLELGVYGGMIDTDPFLDVKTMGGSLGYHFNEFFALHALGWKSYSGTSSAFTRLQAGGASTNLNKLTSFYGAEVAWSPIYGKLSVLGKAIVYYDLHLLGGAGITGSENGNYLTGIVGIGQQIYLEDWVSLKIDYRLMPFSEEEVEEVQTLSTNFGKVIGERTNWSNSLTIGLTFLIGG